VAQTQAPCPRRRGAGERPLLPVLALIVALLTALAVAVRLPPVAGLLGTSLGVPALSGPGPAPENETFGDGGRALLLRMTQAVRRNDVDAFTSVAAARDPSARDHLRRVFTGLAALPLASFTLTVDQGRASRTVPGSRRGVRTLPVLATYRLRGWDDAPLGVPMQLVVAPDGGGWAVVDDRTTTDPATEQRLEPWLFKDLYLTRTRHVLVVGDRGHASQARRLARTLEALTVDVRRVWPERTWNGKVVAYAMTSTTFVRSWFGLSAAGDTANGNGDGHGDRAAFVAKVVTLPSGGAGPGAVRMVLTPYLLERPRSGSIHVLRHEMTHVATARLGSGVPTWLVEGAAEYTGFAQRDGGDDLDATTTFGRHGLTSAEVAATASGRWRPSLLGRPAFYSGSEAAVDEHYNSAFITCLYIADRYGEAALRRLYEDSARTTEAAALSRVLHTTRGRLVPAVGAYASTLRNRLVFR
jgi:hypothetical protein